MGLGWIGCDLDGTIAKYDEWRGVDHIGEPIKPVLDLVKGWLDLGFYVKIFTARASRGGSEGIRAEKAIKAWCKKRLGQELEVTNEKDFDMLCLIDDRAIQVELNTGKILGEIPLGLRV